jgi:hypothetical protein
MIRLLCLGQSMVVGRSIRSAATSEFVMESQPSPCFHPSGLEFDGLTSAAVGRHRGADFAFSTHRKPG